jgi:2-polyprenyl-3-methyl-5-hydroxy-6-metoxy-1,4-benzoquinol methylase
MMMSKLAKVQPPLIEEAIAAMLAEYGDNDWMLKEHWPLNEPHVRLMVSDVLARIAPGTDVRLLDVGCFNGYMSVVFKGLGYDVTGTDACELETRDAIFKKLGIEFIGANFNELQLFARPPAKPFDIIIIAQVIEHILNHPAGLVRSLAEMMRPGGLMIITTPNPVTMMGAVRVLRGRSLLWGTTDFIDEPKIQGGKIITKGEIHYREYTGDELRHLIESAGLRVEKSLYLGLGNSRSQSALKRMVKSNPLMKKLMSRRLFGSNHYFLARKE